MIDLSNFGIRINGTFLDEGYRFQALAARHSLVPDILREVTRGHAFRLLREADRGVFDVEQDRSPRARKYEHAVARVLIDAAGTRVGSCLTSCIKATGKTVWIVPYDSQDMRNSGNCNAYVWEFKPADGGGVRVMFTPQSQRLVQHCGGRVQEDETLLHELVHAARIAHVGMSGLWYDAMRESQDQEEFFAVQVTNMFQSEIGRGPYRRNYGGGTGNAHIGMVTLPALHQYFASDQEARQVIARFLHHEPLAQKLKAVDTPFNPFRDLEKYARAASASPAVRATAGLRP